MYWGWDYLDANGLEVVEQYLQTASAQGKAIAISIMLYEDLGRDATPPRVYASLGRSGGWVAQPAGCAAMTSRLGRWGLEAGLCRVRRQFAARLTGDPASSSRMDCTGIYGRTVVSRTVGSCTSTSRGTISRGGCGARPHLREASPGRRSF
jgi:hypothetical protein